MIDDKIARVKKLIQQREAIDAELAAIFGLADAPRRGRPRKDPSTASLEEAPAADEQVTSES